MKASTVQQHYKKARDDTKEWRAEARELYDLVAGKQWTDAEESEIKDKNRLPVVMNRIAPFIDSILGQQINNRKEVRFLPRENSDTKVSDLYTEAGRWADDMCDGEDEVTDAFYDLIVTGMGWCLSDDALVRCPEVKFATSRFYTGVVIQIDLENGQKLTGTPNHPVLTDVGWKGLHELREGDHLISSRFLERVKGFPVQNFDKVESRLEDKVDAFRAGRKPLRLVTAPDDFYADGAGSKIHVVYADSLLRRQIIKAAVLQRIQQQLFRCWQLAAELGVTFLGHGLLPGSVGAAIGQSTFSVGHSPRAHISGYNVIAERMAGAAQPLPYSFSVKSRAGRDFIGRELFSKIHSLKVAYRHAAQSCSASLSQGIAGPVQPVLHRGTAYSNLLPDFFDTKPLLEIEARNLLGGNGAFSEFKTRVKSRIVRDVIDFRVHDVGTSVGMFVAGDIITSNTETRMDYKEDPAGRLITAERVDPLEMYWDTADTSRNLDKSSWIIRARNYPCEEAEERWPKIKGVQDQKSETDERLREPHDATNAWKYENDQSAYNPHEKTYTVLQCQYYEDKPAYRVADPDSGQVITMESVKVEKLKPYLDSMGIKYVKSTSRHYYQCFVSGETELEKGEAPSQKGFTLRAMTGKRDRNKRTWYGVARALKDPQKFSNKFFSDILYILATNRKGGAFVETDALENPRKAEADWAAADALIKLNPGGLQKVRERDAGVFPAGLDRLMQYAIDAVPATSGLNPEMIGMADRAQAGVLEAQRKQSALVILSPLFDSLKRHQRGRGRIVLDFLHRFIADGRALRITSPEGQAQAVPFQQAPDAETYDIIVDEMPTTPNSKAETFAVLAELVPFMAKMGITPPADTLDYLPLPATLVEKWKQQLSQQKDQQDPAQQMEMAKLQAQQQSEQAKAQMELVKMDFEREKGSVQMSIEQQQAQLQQQQLQLEAAIKQREAEIKAAELQLKQAELSMHAQEIEAQHSLEAEEMNQFSQGLQQMLENMTKVVESLKEENKSTREAAKVQMDTISAILSAPREVVRDERGKATGTRIKANS